MRAERWLASGVGLAAVLSDRQLRRSASDLLLVARADIGAAAPAGTAGGPGPSVSCEPACSCLNCSVTMNRNGARDLTRRTQRSAGRFRWSATPPPHRAFLRTKVRAPGPPHGKQALWPSVVRTTSQPKRLLHLLAHLSQALHVPSPDLGGGPAAVPDVHERLADLVPRQIIVR
jgi:hypothetical protein